MQTPSPSQQRVVDAMQAGVNHLMVEAVAGSGKTTTILYGASKVRGSVVMVAFNKAIAAELTTRLETMGLRNAKAMTFHALGLRAWKGLYPNAQIENNKVAQIMRRLVQGDPLVPTTWQPTIGKLVSLAKQELVGMRFMISDPHTWHLLIDHHDLHLGLPVDAELTRVVSLAQQVFKTSWEEASERIDFDDMIFAPLMGKARFSQYDWVMVDEAQDTNAARRAMVERLVKPNTGRSVWVGDPCQAIYGFTGASADALDVVANVFHTQKLPLHTSFRCSKAVVEYAQTWVSHIESHDGASTGSVEDIDLREFRRTLPVQDGDAILCRNTAPLIQMAFSLIRRGRGCHVEGRDIGKSLSDVVMRFRKKNPTAGLLEFSEHLDTVLKTDVPKLLADGQEEKAQRLVDRIESLHVLLEMTDGTLDDLLHQIGSLFADTDADGSSRQRVTLSTIHKAKGREWHTVWWLGPSKFSPSPYARQDWQKTQEDNLCYVAVTRAQERLVNINYPAKTDPDAE